MDRASDFGSEDCGFDPRRGQEVFPFLLSIVVQSKYRLPRQFKNRTCCRESVVTRERNEDKSRQFLLLQIHWNWHLSLLPQSRSISVTTSSRSYWNRSLQNSYLFRSLRFFACVCLSLSTTLCTGVRLSVCVCECVCFIVACNDFLM